MSKTKLLYYLISLISLSIVISWSETNINKNQSLTPLEETSADFWESVDGSLMTAKFVAINRDTNGHNASVTFDIKGRKVKANWSDLSESSQEKALLLEEELALQALQKWQNKNNPKKQTEAKNTELQESNSNDPKISLLTNLTTKIKSFFPKSDKKENKNLESKNLLGSVNNLITKAKKNVTDLTSKQDSSSSPTNSTSSSSYITSINNDMLRLQKGLIKASPNSATPKYIAIYYSAHWCPPCRAFTPKLVNFYNKNKGGNFELVFVSSDENQSTMNKYITGDKMPWLVLPYAQVKRSKMWTKFAGRGIPCLVVIDRNGKVLLDSYKGSSYIGPHQVMNDLQKLISN